MPARQLLDSTNESFRCREVETTEAHRHDTLQSIEARNLDMRVSASETPEFHEIGFDATTEWAHRTLARFNEIWTGHTLRPTGWSDWELRIGVDHTGMRAVTASAVRQSGAFANISFKIAEMVSPAELNNAIQEFFGDLKRARDLRGPLEHLAKQPTPVLPGWLVAKLEEDIVDEATRRFNEARAVLGASGQRSGSTAASR